MKVDQRTVIGAGRETSPQRIDGRVAREPYDCTQPFCVTAKPSRFSAKYCTMSLRSGSPCTSTSRPMRSCSSTTLRDLLARGSPRTRSGEISPLPRRARAPCGSLPVCGNEPIVVVGSDGQVEPHPARPAASRSRRGGSADSSSAAARSRHRAVAHAGGAGAVGERGGCGVELARHRVAALDEAARQHRDLADLLVGEGQPAHES